AADPDIALVVDVNAMVRLRPLIALTRATPGADQAAILIVDQDRRGGAAALRDRRIELGAALVVVQAAGAAMNDPDVILLVDPCADRPAQEPVVGNRLRPERIDLVDGRRYARALRIGVLLQQRLADAKRDNPGGERDAGHEF